MRIVQYMAGGAVGCGVQVRDDELRQDTLVREQIGPPPAAIEWLSRSLGTSSQQVRLPTAGRS